MIDFKKWISNIKDLMTLRKTLTGLSYMTNHWPQLTGKILFDLEKLFADIVFNEWLDIQSIPISQPNEAIKYSKNLENPFKNWHT